MRPATMLLMRDAQGFSQRSFIIVIIINFFFARQTMDGYQKKTYEAKPKKMKKQDDYEQRIYKKNRSRAFDWAY